MPQLVIDIEKQGDVAFAKWLFRRAHQWNSQHPGATSLQRTAGNLEAFARDVRYQSVERSNGRTWAMLLAWARADKPLPFQQVAERVGIPGIDAAAIARWKRTLGKPERRHGVKALARQEDGSWQMSPDMKQAIIGIEEEAGG